MDEPESVAIVGVGEMGEPMAEHLIDAAYDVVVYDVATDPLERLEARGAEVVASPGQAAANADVTLVLVGTADQVETVLEADDGVFAMADAGHVVALGSTLSPEQCVYLGDEAEKYGVDVVDVPICRGNRAARNAELLVLGGGEKRTFARLRPVLERFGDPDDVIYLGPLGSGQVTKAANNTIMWSILVANYEVLSLVDQYDLDLDLDEVRNVLSRSSADNWVLREWDWMYSKWAHKDMAITASMADAKDHSMPVASVVGETIEDITEADLDKTR
ncbi:MAG: NAD(P)-dependent oxidoreductase [Halobacteriota archaeon]